MSPPPTAFIDYGSSMPTISGSRTEYVFPQRKIRLSGGKFHADTDRKASNRNVVCIR